MNQDQLTPDQSPSPFGTPSPSFDGPQPDQKPTVLSHLGRYGVVAIAVALLVVAGGITTMALAGKNTPKKADVKQAQADSSKVAEEQEKPDTPASTSGVTALIELDANGATPDSLTVAPGTTVVWKNTSSKSVALSGDLIGSKNAVDKASSFSYVYSQPGDYTFSDGTHQGSVTVRE